MTKKLPSLNINGKINGKDIPLKRKVYGLEDIDADRAKKKSKSGGGKYNDLDNAAKGGDCGDLDNVAGGGNYVDLDISAKCGKYNDLDYADEGGNYGDLDNAVEGG